MNIKRTAATKRKCNHPSCWQTKKLKTIPIELRYKIAVDEKVFVPSNAVACQNHINSDAWKNVNQIIESESSEYSKQYLVDMFDLLSNPPSKISETKESRMYSYYKTTIIHI